MEAKQQEKMENLKRQKEQEKFEEKLRRQQKLIDIQFENLKRIKEEQENRVKKFDNYRNTNNTPICNGRTVLRFKTLSENKIKDENVVQLIKME